MRKPERQLSLTTIIRGYGAHYWARVLAELGHQVRLIAPQHVKPYVKRNKNDGRDAEGLCEAMSRPTMGFVPVKTAEQQAGLMLSGIREQLIARRTQLSNTIRGYAAEFGITEAKGLDKIEPLLARIAQDESVPALARDLFMLQGREYTQLQVELKAIEARLRAWHRANADSRRLAKIPGVGPIGATALVMKTPDPRAFPSGRHLKSLIVPAFAGTTTGCRLAAYFFVRDLRSCISLSSSSFC